MVTNRVDTPYQIQLLQDLGTDQASQVKYGPKFVISLLEYVRSVIIALDTFCFFQVIYDV